MAYTAVVTFEPTLSGASTAHRVRKGTQFRVTITETDSEATSEATIAFGKYFVGMIRRLDVIRSAGTAATFAPCFGPTSDPLNKAGSVAKAATAYPVSENTHADFFTSATGDLFWRVTPNAGNDNDTVSTLLIEVL